MIGGVKNDRNEFEFARTLKSRVVELGELYISLLEIILLVG